MKIAGIEVRESAEVPKGEVWFVQLTGYEVRESLTRTRITA